jgi:hypothetical protein
MKPLGKYVSQTLRGSKDERLNQTGEDQRGRQGDSLSGPASGRRGFLQRRSKVVIQSPATTESLRPRITITSMPPSASTGPLAALPPPAVTAQTPLVGPGTRLEVVRSSRALPPAQEVDTGVIGQHVQVTQAQMNPLPSNPQGSHVQRDGIEVSNPATRYRQQVVSSPYAMPLQGNVDVNAAYEHVPAARAPTNAVPREVQASRVPRSGAPIAPAHAYRRSESGPADGLAGLAPQRSLSPYIQHLYKVMKLAVTKDTWPAYTTANLVDEPRLIGSGSFNAVFEVRLRNADGSVFHGVFKPLNARDDGWASKAMGIPPDNPQLAMRNLATLSYANKLGLNVIPDMKMAVLRAPGRVIGPVLGMVMECRSDEATAVGSLNGAG